MPIYIIVIALIAGGLGVMLGLCWGYEMAADDAVQDPQPKEWVFELLKARMRKDTYDGV